jgi:translation initiation factor 1 (eIF-1/SUI1)
VEDGALSRVTCRDAQLIPESHTIDPPTRCMRCALAYGANIFFPSTERNGRKTLTTVQGLPKKFDRKKILKVIKKKFGMSLSLSMIRSKGVYG